MGLREDGYEVLAGPGSVAMGRMAGDRERATNRLGYPVTLNSRETAA